MGFQKSSIGLSLLLCIAVPAFQSLAEVKGAQASASGNPATQSIMHSVFAPLSEVLPLSFDRVAFSDPKNRAAVEKNLQSLADSASNLERHGTTQARAFEYVAKSLASDARRAQRWYAKGRFEEAEFIIHNITANCIECHASLPESHRVPPAAKFFSDIKMDKLPPLERAHFQVVSRQFDDALRSYEEIFQSPKIDPMNLVILGSFSDYLKVSIEVKSDFTRPQKTLEMVAARPSTPPHVKNQIGRWLTSLQTFEAEKVLSKTDLQSARKILEDGRKMMEFPRDRDGLIHFITAHAILNRFVHSRPDRGVDVAEAYYLLGVTESLFSHSFWVSRTDFDFESAIRLAPGADFAPKAYALLEDSYVFNYSGSSGTNVPEDVQQLLFELRRLIQEAQGRKT